MLSLPYPREEDQARGLIFIKHVADVVPLRSKVRNKGASVIGRWEFNAETVLLSLVKGFLSIFSLGDFFISRRHCLFVSGHLFALQLILSI